MLAPVALASAWEQVHLTGRIPQSSQPFFRPGGRALSSLLSAANASLCAASGQPAPSNTVAASASSIGAVNAEDIQTAGSAHGPIARVMQVGDRLEVEAAIEEGEEPQWLLVCYRDQNRKETRRAAVAANLFPRLEPQRGEEPRWLPLCCRRVTRQNKEPRTNEHEP